ESVETDVEAALFASFTNRRSHQRFPSIDVAAGKHPLAVTGIDGAPYEHEAAGAGPDNRADGNLRIEIKHKPAARADGPFGLGRFPRARSSCTRNQGPRVGPAGRSHRTACAEVCRARDPA